jgi:predicted nuclease of predicted toxin-antitoxin system
MILIATLKGFLRSLISKIIWVRTGNLTTDEIAQLLISNQKIIEPFLHDPEFSEIACLELDK